jgi:hypothetical protein
LLLPKLKTIAADCKAVNQTVEKIVESPIFTMVSEGMDWEVSVSRDGNENSSWCYNATQDVLDAGQQLVVDVTQDGFKNPWTI